MRLRYLHLGHYPPIKDLAVHFASGSPLNRECAIRFVVGVNGSGKSNLLRAVAEVFLALSDERLPPFPVSLIYELGQRGHSGHYTFIVDCQGNKSEASLWVAEDWNWEDTDPQEVFEIALEQIRDGNTPEHFREFIKRGTWPQSAGIALPKAVLAYTTGALRPWRSIWERNQDADGFITTTDSDEYDPTDERPEGWTSTLEEATLSAIEKKEQSPFDDETSSISSDVFRRPILLNQTLLKCALLAVTLPQAFIKSADYHGKDEVEVFLGKTPLQKLLERGGWHHLVSVSFDCRLQLKTWDRMLRETAHDWLLCSGATITEPHPTESRRTLYFDLKGSFSGQNVETFMPNDCLDVCVTQGEALLCLLGGNEATAFELFNKLVALHQAGLFDEVELRLRRQPSPTSNSDTDEYINDIGVLRYEELSDGEQMLLGRMALFHLLHDQQDALLLLDEPETHFNDKWKREIVDIIDDAIGDTANDVLISTHSAIVLSDVFNEEIVMVDKTEEGSVIRTVTEQTFATDPSALMMTVFDADDSIGKRAQEFIEEKLSQASGTDDEIKQLEQLINRMGTGFYRSELRTLLNQWKSTDNA